MHTYILPKNQRNATKKHLKTIKMFLKKKKGDILLKNQRNATKKHLKTIKIFLKKK